jgi:hypothetical protein
MREEGISYDKKNAPPFRIGSRCQSLEDSVCVSADEAGERGVRGASGQCTKGSISQCFSVYLQYFTSRSNE